jgi:hypothetical protein
MEGTAVGIDVGTTVGILVGKVGKAVGAVEGDHVTKYWTSRRVDWKSRITSDWTKVESFSFADSAFKADTKVPFATDIPKTLLM